MNNQVHVIGGGGHAKVVISTLYEMGMAVHSVWDDDPRKWGSSVLGVTVQGPVEELEGVSGFKAVVAVGDNRTRRSIVQRLEQADWITAVHPRAYVHPTVQVGKGSVIFAGAVVQPEARIEDHVIVNTCASVDHDCRIASFCHLCPGTHLAGTVTLGEGVFVGTGSSVIPGISVGAWAILGAGAVLTKDLSFGAKVAGVPARSI